MPQFHTLSISEVRKETEDTVSIAFDVPPSLKDDYVFIQGQYLTLRADINGEDGDHDGVEVILMVMIVARLLIIVTMVMTMNC